MILAVKLCDKSKILFIICALVIFQGLFFESCALKEDSSVKFFQGETMGTSYSVKYVVSHEKDVNSVYLKTKVDEALLSFNLKVSTYIHDSEISVFNESMANHWYKVSYEFYDIVKTAKDIWKKTNGQYDISVAPLVNLWGFGPEKSRKTPPNSQEVEVALKNIGLDQLHLREGEFLKKDKEALHLDLSSIAKGYGVDLIGRLLERNGVLNYMVEIGGEVFVKGKKGKEDWKIGITFPQKNIKNSRVAEILKLTNMAMATSGDYRNFFEENGKSYSHTIDVKSGYPVQFPLTSVTVIDPESCARADAWATALMALVPIEGPKIAQKYNIAALFLIKEKTSLASLSIKKVKTPKFEELF